MNNKDKIELLEDYTKNKSLYGQNDSEILDKFVQYARFCADPLNIFNYMEEKSICIFLAHFWLAYANVYSDIGNFKNAFICIKQAKQRKDIVSENQINFSLELVRLKDKVRTAMKRKASKRRAEQYQLLYEEGQIQDIWKYLEDIIKIYDENYDSVKRELENKYNSANKEKQKSWLMPLNEQKQQKIKKIQEEMHTHSKNQTFMSLRTPLSKKNPLRFTNTMDSVQILKKKQTTLNKTNRKERLFDVEVDQEEEEYIRNCNTTPVGRVMDSLKRRVTFNADIGFEKLRSDKEEEAENASDKKDKSLIKRPSILRNSNRTSGEKDK